MLYALYGAVFWVPVVGALFGLGVVLVVRSTLAPMWMRRRSSCGGCGYELESLGAGVCPECGASLLRVGVASPRMAVRLRSSAFLLVVGWTLMASMVTLPVLGAAMLIAQNANRSGMMPGFSEARRVLDATLEPAKWGGPGGGVTRQPEAYQIGVRASVDIDGFGFTTGGTVELSFIGTPKKMVLEQNLSTGVWRLKEGRSVVLEGVGLDSGSSAQVYAAVGLDLGRDTTAAEADFLSGAIDMFALAPNAFRGSQHGSGDPLVYNGYSTRLQRKGDILGTGMNIEEFTPYAVGLGAIGVYAAGLYGFLRRRARLLRCP